MTDPNINEAIEEIECINTNMSSFYLNLSVNHSTRSLLSE